MRNHFASPQLPFNETSGPSGRVGALLGWLAFLFVSSAGGSATAPAANRPNIVILYADDMGYGQPSVYGGKLAPTPHIDALAAGGVRFTHGYATACVCSPSRVGIMTGRHQARTGHDGLTTEDPTHFLLRSETLLPERLHAAGYVTGLVGKWHLGSTEGYRPTDRGFDRFYGTYTNKNECERYFRGRDAIAKPPVDSPVFAEESVRFIRENKKRPFFLYQAFTAVHAPVEASPIWLERFAHISNPRDRVYAAMAAELDAAVGVIIAALREQGVEENTLIFFTSDNGGASPSSDNGPFRGGKWSLLEGGIREPMIVQWKTRIRPGQVIDVPVSQLDFFPTALAAAALPVPSDPVLDGVDLLPLLTGAATAVKRDALYWRFGPQLAIRVGDWKLVRSERDETVALYNLASDPSESRDLSATEPARAKALLERWQQWNVTMHAPRWADARMDGLRHRQELLQQRGERRKAKKAGD